MVLVDKIGVFFLCPHMMMMISFSKNVKIIIII